MYAELTTTNCIWEQSTPSNPQGRQPQVGWLQLATARSNPSGCVHGNGLDYWLAAHGAEWQCCRHEHLCAAPAAGRREAQG